MGKHLLISVTTKNADAYKAPAQIAPRYFAGVTLNLFACAGGEVRRFRSFFVFRYIIALLFGFVKRFFKLCVLLFSTFPPAFRPGMVP